MLKMILVLVLIIVAVIFAVQNADPVAVWFLAWKFEASLAVIMLLSVVTGLLIGAGAVSFWRLRRAMRERKASQPGTGEEEPRI